MSENAELIIELPYGVTQDEARTMLAVKLYESDRISLGQAAKLAGYSKQAFIEVLGRQQIPVFNYSPDDLRQELGL